MAIPVTSPPGSSCTSHSGGEVPQHQRTMRRRVMRREPEAVRCMPRAPHRSHQSLRLHLPLLRSEGSVRCCGKEVQEVLAATEMGLKRAGRLEARRANAREGTTVSSAAGCLPRMSGETGSSKANVRLLCTCACACARLLVCAREEGVCTRGGRGGGRKGRGENLCFCVFMYVRECLHARARASVAMFSS